MAASVKCSELGLSNNANNEDEDHNDKICESKAETNSPAVKTASSTDQTDSQKGEVSTFKIEGEDDKTHLAVQSTAGQLDTPESATGIMNSDVLGNGSGEKEIDNIVTTSSPKHETNVGKNRTEECDVSPSTNASECVATGPEELVSNDKTLVADVNQDKTLVADVNQDKTLVADVNQDKTLVADVNQDKTLVADVNQDKTLVAEVNQDKTLVAEVNQDKTLVAEVNQDKTLVAEVNQDKTLVAEVNQDKILVAEVNQDKTLVAEVNQDKTLVAGANQDKPLVSEANQDKTFCKDKCASGDSVSSFGTEQPSDGKPKFKSEISVDDNVFEEGTKAQGGASSEAAPTGETVSLPGAGQKGGVETHEGRPVREMLVRRSRTESTESSSDKPVLETLTFNASKKVETIKDEETTGNDVCVCLLCERSYPSDNKEDVLAHLVLMHRFVIADVNFIGHLPEYMRYWKRRFEEKPFAEFCSKIVTNVGVKDDASKEEFFLLCDALPEDKELRESLQRKKLESVLAQQQKEREETKFCRQCLFCKQTFCGNRAVLIDHLVRDHSFHMGRPDNLVFTDEMFNLIQLKLDNQLCLFCEKSFKDKASLKEHMRKKQHRKINPKHKEYDRFYIVNYMEMGKNWQSLQSEDNRPVKTSEKCTNEEEDWSGWNAESESGVVCLFCDMSFVTVSELQEHMKDKHTFDLHDVSSKLHLNFYQKVKLINYIRRQIYHKTCYGCHQAFDGKEELLAHLDKFSEHIQKVPENEVWDQPQYFFPTYEDDGLLCNLDDDDDDDEGAAGDVLGGIVIKEDIPVNDTILKDKKLCQDLRA